MILSCPECATSYFVDDARVPPEGRTVKCSSCGARWRAVPEPEPDAAPAPAPASSPEPETFDPSPDPFGAVAELADPPSPAIDAAFVEPEPAMMIAPPFDARPKRRRGVGGLVAILAVAAVVAIAVGAAIMFRSSVVQMVPETAKAYAAIGLPAGRDGLVIEQVASKAILQAGRPVLSVTGAIHNTRDRTVSAPTLRVSLLDKAGKPLATKLARPLNPAIPAGARRYFAIAIAEPPSGSHDLEVVFDDSPGVAAAAAQPASFAVDPVEAKPLPAGSPDALPDHG